MFSKHLPTNGESPDSEEVTVGHGSVGLGLARSRVMSIKRRQGFIQAPLWPTRVARDLGYSSPETILYVPAVIGYGS
jgi:hypothetical protein